MFVYCETGECFLEELPGNKRTKVIMEALILKKVKLGTKIITTVQLNSQLFSLSIEPFKSCPEATTCLY